MEGKTEPEGLEMTRKTEMVKTTVIEIETGGDREIKECAVE